MPTRAPASFFSSRIAFSSTDGSAPSPSYQSRTSLMVDVRRACSRSGWRVSSTIGSEPARQHGALEEDEAARVEAGQVVEALLREQKNGVELLAP